MGELDLQDGIGEPFTKSTLCSVFPPGQYDYFGSTIVGEGFGDLVAYACGGSGDNGYFTGQVRDVGLVEDWMTLDGGCDSGLGHSWFGLMCSGFVVGSFRRGKYNGKGLDTQNGLPFYTASGMQ